MKRLALVLILAAGPAFAQQLPPSPEVQAVQQMYAQSQQNEYALRVEAVKLKAENAKLSETAKHTPPAPPKP